METNRGVYNNITTRHIQRVEVSWNFAELSSFIESASTTFEKKFEVPAGPRRPSVGSYCALRR